MPEHAVTAIDIQLNNVTIKENVDRPLLWYDTETKIMHAMHGGQLKYTYLYGKKRIMLNTTKETIKEINAWMDKHPEIEKEKEDNGKIVAHFPEKKSKEIQESLQEMQKNPKDPKKPKFGFKILKSKTIAEPSDLEVSYKKINDNSDDILEWVEENEKHLGLKVVMTERYQVVIKYPIDNKKKVEESLYAKRLRFEHYA